MKFKNESLSWILKIYCHVSFIISFLFFKYSVLKQRCLICISRWKTVDETPDLTQLGQLTIIFRYVTNNLKISWFLQEERRGWSLYHTLIFVLNKDG